MMADDDLTRVRDWPRWALPSHGLRIDAIDVHCGGEPLRLVIGGFPAPIGSTMAGRSRYAREHLDHLRRALISEPRGHARQYGALLTAPERQGSQFGALFFNHGGFRPVSGHGIIAVATALVECGLVSMNGPETRLKLDTEAGLVRAFARIEDARVRSVFFENVPAYVVALDASVEVPDLGPVRYDLAFAGVAYAFIEADSLGLGCSSADSDRLREVGGRLQPLIFAHARSTHPGEPALDSPGGVVFFDQPPRRRGAETTSDTRHACVFTEGEINRSPGGAAISARMAIEFAKGHLELGAAIVVEGMAGATFVGKAVEESNHGAQPAVITEIEGSAFITGSNALFIDPSDPFRNGMNPS